MDELKVRLATPSTGKESHAMAYIGGAIDLMRSYRLKSDRIKGEELYGLDEDFNAVSTRQTDEQIVFARVAGGIAGHVRFTAVCTSGITCIDELFVKPAFRGFGIERELVEAVVYASRMRGNREVQVVASKASKEFYEKIGFVENLPCRNEMSLDISKKGKMLQ